MKSNQKGTTMRTSIILTTAAAALTFALTGCATGDPGDAETVTETTTETTTAPAPEPSTETVTETAEPAEPAEGNDSSLGSAILDMAWSQQTQSDKQDVCDGYAVDPEAMLDTFMEEFESDPEVAGMVTREQAEAFFDKECA